MKSTFELPDGCRIVYRIDDFTDRWKPADTLLFVHGLGESGEVWRQWVPYFARQFRVVRIDLRGFGESTPMPPDFGWSLDAVAHVYGVKPNSVKLGLWNAERFSLVEAKKKSLLQQQALWKGTPRKKFSW